MIVQSNPVELGVHVFAQHLRATRVLGAAGWSDTLRFRQELAAELGVPRRNVGAFVFGQHGDHLVPIWSMIGVHGVPRSEVDSLIARTRRGRHLVDLAGEVVTERGAVLDLIRAGRVQDAYDHVTRLPADLRVAVKPFFTAFTSGRTTEAVTAHAAADLVAAIINGSWITLPAQISDPGGRHGIESPLATPVVLGPNGWINAIEITLADDEIAALQSADAAVSAAISSALAG